MFERLYHDYRSRVPYGILCYYWAVEYKDKIIPQFDPATGVERIYGELPPNKTAIGWYPFPTSLARKLLDRGLLVRPKQLPVYKITLKPGEIPILLRRNCMTMTDHGLVRKITYVLGKEGQFLWLIDEDGRRTIQTLRHPAEKTDISISSILTTARV